MRGMIRRILLRLRLLKMRPHEKAQAGLGPWGRRAEGPASAGRSEAQAEGKASVKMRVIRADGTIEEVK